jgi:dTDP-4-dehydrorhamnose reductase
MQPQSVVITGAAGMLGTALLASVPAGIQAVGVDLPDGDITVLEGARAALTPHRPDVVIHCAAYTDVDGCTRNPDLAFSVNANGTRNVAAVCHELGAFALALSTDYVFDGARGDGYVETDAPHPLNPYGESKLQGEQWAAQAHDRLLIVRTQWLYGPNGKNFPRTIARLGRERGAVKVVADEYGSPTFTHDLARRIWELVALQPTGIIHCANDGICTWADLARVVLDAAGLPQVPVEPISWRDWPSPTTRPHYSSLVSGRLQELGLGKLRPWQEAATEYAAGYLHESEGAA